MKAIFLARKEEWTGKRLAPQMERLVVLIWRVQFKQMRVATPNDSLAF